MKAGLLFQANFPGFFSIVDQSRLEGGKHFCDGTPVSQVLVSEPHRPLQVL